MNITWYSGWFYQQFKKVGSTISFTQFTCEKRQQVINLSHHIFCVENAIQLVLASTRSCGKTPLHSKKIFFLPLNLSMISTIEALNWSALPFLLNWTLFRISTQCDMICASQPGRTIITKQKQPSIAKHSSSSAQAHGWDLRNFPGWRTPWPSKALLISRERATAAGRTDGQTDSGTENLATYH